MNQKVFVTEAQHTARYVTGFAKIHLITFYKRNWYRYKISACLLS